MRRSSVIILLSLAVLLADGRPGAGAEWAGVTRSATDKVLRQRIERALDRWCRWLAGYVRPVPDTDYYTMSPRPQSGRNAYRDVAGNQFAAAAAGYWLARANPPEELARPLRGLIRLSLDSHIAIGRLDRPEGPRWGAGHSPADNWHADLFAGTSGMLMFEALSAEQRQQLLTILAWEADKQVEYGISKEHNSMPGRWPEHSVGEANAWSCALLQAARTALPDSPRQAAWRDTAVTYSLNAISLPADVASAEVVAGRPLKDRVKGANFEPGGIQEHHGFYHPGYVGWPLAYQAYAMLLDEHLPAPQRNADVYLRNWQLVFDRLKQGSFANGRFIYCAGYDWNAYGYGNAHILPIGVFAAARFRDPDASRLAHEWLALVEREQDLGDGSVQGVRLERLKNNYSNDFAWYEAVSGASLAHALWVMDHMDTSALPPPASEVEYNARHTGTYHEPNARLVWHRTASRWASSSWRSAFGQWQAVVQPVGLPNLLKFNHNGIGMLKIAGATPKTSLRSFQIGTFDAGGFWSLGTIDHLVAGPGQPVPMVRQFQALVALPEGLSIFVDRCQAMEPVEVERDAALGWRLAADIFNDQRVKLTVAGADHVFGQDLGQDTWHSWKVGSLAIEDALRLQIIAGDGEFQLLQKRRRPVVGEETMYAGDTFAVEESLVSHELYFGMPLDAPPRKFEPGQWIRELVVLVDCERRDAASQPTAAIIGSHPCFAVQLIDAGRTVVINFADTQQTAPLPGGPALLAPLSVHISP